MLACTRHDVSNSRLVRVAGFSLKLVMTGRDCQRPGRMDSATLGTEKLANTHVQVSC